MPRHGALVDAVEIPSLATLYGYDGLVPLVDTAPRGAEGGPWGTKSREMRRGFLWRGTRADTSISVRFSEQR